MPLYSTTQLPSLSTVPPLLTSQYLHATPWPSTYSTTWLHFMPLYSTMHSTYSTSCHSLHKAFHILHKMLHILYNAILLKLYIVAPRSAHLASTPCHSQASISMPLHGTPHTPQCGSPQMLHIFSTRHITSPLHATLAVHSSTPHILHKHSTYSP